MAFLLCSYASERSRPEKIEAWISELVGLREVHRNYPDRVETIDLFLERARGWLEGAKAPAGEAS
ncbi:MAG: hypothetical protein GEU90_12090 [Gemmatimonas sp.]|nr:hypothetical protein [Gemmatimonas sp.]